MTDGVWLQLGDERFDAWGYDVCDVQACALWHVLASPANEIIDDVNRMSQRACGLRQMRADKACAASNENPHGPGVA